MNLEAGKVHPIYPIALVDDAPDNAATFGQLDFADNPLIVAGPALDLTQATPGDVLEVRATGLVNFGDGSSRTETFVASVLVVPAPTPRVQEPHSEAGSVAELLLNLSPVFLSAPADSPDAAAPPAGAPMPPGAPSNADAAATAPAPQPAPEPAHQYGAALGFK
jgi:hypothetical protein